MIKGLIGLMMLSLTLGIAQPAKAALKFQSALERWCAPAGPGRIEVLRWKAPGTCTSDCFEWTLTCTNKKTVLLQSAMHPQTSQWQYDFYRWAPWSIAALLLPLVLFAGVAVIGAWFHAAVLTLNALLIAYVGYAAFYFYASVTGDPRSYALVLATLVYAKPIVFAIVTVILVAVNSVAFWQGCRRIFGRRAAPVDAILDDPLATAVSAAFMPHIDEIDDPAQAARYYRQETRAARALKSRLDAHTKSLRARVEAARAKAERNPV